MELHQRDEPTRPRTVGILLYDSVEVLDFSGPYEVFVSARPDGQGDDSPALFDLMTVAEERRLVQCNGGLRVQPDCTIDDDQAFDILVVPGGAGTRRELGNRRLLDWIAARNERTEITMGVCTGALLLAESGVLDGVPAATHWYWLDWMRDRYPAVEMRSGARLVDTGHVMTSAGISAGIDLALHLVERLHGRSAAAWTAHRLEHLWSHQYRTIFDASADAILIVDPGGRIAEANNTAGQLFGHARDDMVGMEMAALAPIELRDELAAHVSSVAHSGSAEIRSVAQRQNGTRFPAELRSTAFEYRGMPHVLAMVRDITARVEAEEVVQQERQRLSRELHDSVSQALYSIALGARTARALAERGETGLAAPLDFVLEQAERGLAEIRALIFELRPEALEQEGLVAALSRRAEVLASKHEVHLDLALGDEPAAALSIKEALYRIGQEAMHNTIKHARATEIRLELASMDGTIVLAIRDNGRGFDPTGSFPGHLGLQSMRERAAQLGGTLEVESAAGSGTSITVRIPVGVLAPTAPS